MSANRPRVGSEDRKIAEAERAFMKALQKLAKLEGHDPLCHLCLRATAENNIVWWNEERKKRRRP